MKLILAEKPDQGAKLAAPFRSQKKTGYLQVEANEFFQMEHILAGQSVIYVN